MKRLAVIAPLLIVGLFGCAEDSESPKVIAEPVVGGADSLRSVDVRSRLKFEEAVEGVINEDMTFHGYEFASMPTGQFSVEVTQLGTSRGLDTSLWVYGRASGSNWERIAFDDDAGWGALSKVKGLKAGDFKEFMAVVGTADSMGRGDYRLSLTCDNDACVDDTIISVDGCDDTVFEVYDACVVHDLESAEYTPDEPGEEIAIDYCGDNSGALETYDEECQGEAGEAAYCRISRDDVKSVSGACLTRLKAAYYVVDPISLSHLELSAELEEIAQGLLDSSDATTTAQLQGFKVPAGATLVDVVSTVRTQHNYSSALMTSGAQSRTDFLAQVDTDYRDVVDAIESEYGVDYGASTLSGSYYVAAGAEAWTSVYVMYFAEVNIGFAMSIEAGE